MTKDDHSEAQSKVRVITGTGDIRLAPATLVAHGTVTAMREIAVSVEPSLADDLDHLIAQLREQSEPYLRAIVSEPEETCVGIAIESGEVGWVTIGELAKGELQDREKASQKGTEWWKIFVTAMLTVVGMLVLSAVTGK